MAIERKRLAELTMPDEAGWYKVAPENETAVLDILEALVACVVFSYSAIEAFANVEIPDDFKYRSRRSSKTRKTLFGKAEIERQVSLDEKLHAILPGIFGVQSPKSTDTWADYVWLRDLRNRFVHLKSHDWKYSRPESADDHVWTPLFGPKALTAPTISVSVISHYYPLAKPSWILRFWDASDIG